MSFAKTLQQTFGVNSPILLAEIRNLFSTYSRAHVFKEIASAIERGELVRYDESIYFVPEKDMFGVAGLNPDKVVYKKFIKNNDGVIGGYTGWAFLNSIGATTQMPNVVEIATNRESMRVREVKVGKQKFILRKPKCEITSGNEKVIKIMETATRFEFSEKMSKVVTDYARENNLSVKDFLGCAKFYPAQTIKNITGVLYGLA